MLSVFWIGSLIFAFIVQIVLFINYLATDVVVPPSDAIKNDAKYIKYSRDDTSSQISPVHESEPQVYRIPDTQVHRIPDTQVHRIPDTQVHRIPDTQVHRGSEKQKRVNAFITELIIIRKYILSEMGDELRPLHVGAMSSAASNLLKLNDVSSAKAIKAFNKANFMSDYDESKKAIDAKRAVNYVDDPDDPMIR